MKLTVPLICSLLVLIFPTYSSAVTVRNSDSKVQTVFVTDSEGRRDVAIKSDQQVSLCLKGCFMTFPNGDKFALEGDETLEITNGRANFR